MIINYIYIILKSQAVLWSSAVLLCMLVCVRRGIVPDDSAAISLAEAY